MTIDETIARFFHDVDRQDWDAIRSILDDTVRCDYTSLFGGDVETITAEQLVTRWQALLPGFDVTQHFLGPLAPAAQPIDSLASWECNVRAHHRIGDQEWMVAGRYTLAMRASDDGPRLAAITLHTTYQEGNTDLPRVAAHHVEQASQAS